MTSRDRRRAAVVQGLTGWLNAYSFPMPSAQRLFLLSELQAIGTTFPTYEAERLAAQWLESGDGRGGAGLESTLLPEIWKLSAKSGRAIALLRTAAVQDSMRILLKDSGSMNGVSFEVVPPGSPSRS